MAEFVGEVQIISIGIIKGKLISKQVYISSRKYKELKRMLTGRVKIGEKLNTAIYVNLRGF